MHRTYGTLMNINSILWTKLILMLWHCWLVYVACRNHSQNDLWCVRWNV